MTFFSDAGGFPRPFYDAPGGAAGTKSAEDYAAEVKAAFEKAHDKTREIAEKALAESKDGKDLATGLKEKADESLLKLNGLREELEAVNQRISRGLPASTGGSQKSLGEQFVDSDSYQALAKSAGQRGRATLELKTTLTSVTTDTAGAVGAALEVTRRPGIVAIPQRRMTVRDLITPGRMDGNSLEYVKETGFTNSAAPVAETAAKPASDMKFALVTTSARVIAHYTKASRQIIDDVSQLRSYIDNRLLYGLAYVEEAQLLSGDGTGQNLLGIIPQATAYAAPITVTSPTSIDLLRLAILQVALAEYPASGIVLHPADWAFIELLKDDVGRYIIGNPQGTISPTLWGVNVVATPAMTIDKFLVGAFMLGAQIFDRWLARVELATENEDDFVKNVVTILAEERLALAVYRPTAFVYGDMGRAA